MGVDLEGARGREARRKAAQAAEQVPDDVDFDTMSPQQVRAVGQI